MKKKLAQDALKLICRKYQGDCGESRSSLDEYRFDYFVFADLSSESKIAARIAEDYELLVWVIDELETMGYVTKRSEEFVITSLGLEAGTENIVQTFLRFLNHNPGLAIVISFISLAVSFGAFYVSVTKP